MTPGADDSEGRDPHAGQPIVTSGAPRAAAEVGVVLLHGRGATAQGVTNLADPLYRRGVAFFAPQAARSRWYPHGFDAPREHNEPHLSSALGRVDAALDRARKAGIPRERVVLWGFSQGACIACEYAARNPARYGGVVALSGGLLGPEVDASAYADAAERAGETAGTGALDGTPVFLGVGDADDRVPVERVRATGDVFRALDEADVTVRVYEGVGHAVTDDEFAWTETLLDDVFGTS